ncbi:hypothetical protein COBT_000381 [Conglomerata obtusa]
MEQNLDLSIIKTVLTDRDSTKMMQHINTMIGTKHIHNLEKTIFPGSHPITLLKKHIPPLLCKNYYVCEKSDGVRVLMYIYTSKSRIFVFFIDRKCKIYNIDIPMAQINHTLFDGELYFDEIDGKKQLTYAIFDTILFNGNSVVEDNLQHRLGYAFKYVSKHMHLNYPKIIVKSMSKSYGFCEVYNNLSVLYHKNDGLIFTPVDLPYVPGRCDYLFKWKPGDLNTCDFLLKKVSGCFFLYEMNVFGKYNELKVFDYFFDRECDDPERLNGKIVEMCFDKEVDNLNYVDFSVKKGGWKIYKIRVDKETPNSHKVVINVLFSIKEAITFEQLETYYDKMRENWKAREKENNDI